MFSRKIMAQRKTSSKTRKTTKKRTKKAKVYIAPYKIIILCAAIIAICMSLLLITTISSQHGVSEDLQFVKHFENSTNTEKTEINKSAKPAKSATTAEKEKSKAEQKKATVEAEKAAAKKKAEEKALAEKLEAQKKAEAKARAEAEKLASKKQAEEKAKTEKKDNKPVPQKPQEIVRTPDPQNSQSGQNTQNTQNSPKPQETNTVQSPRTENKYNFPEAKNGAQLVFLLDDGGQNINHLNKFLAVPFPLTIAVLPKLAYSKESAAKVRAAVGKELMLHQPMQAVNANVNPGPGAITPQMSASEICTTLFQNINEIGPIAGLNNHEGSQITADAEKMEVILKYASEAGIFFLDSRTNADSKVAYVSKELGLTYYERNGRFLDNEKTRENALNEIRKNLDIANRDGVVIMIGHIWSADFLPAVLTEIYPELVAKGYTFKTVSACRGIKR